MMRRKIPRGYRNNNPLNIRRGQPWAGLVAGNHGFCKFKTPYYGLRAAIMIMGKYEQRGWRSIEEIIKHWAPPNENLTDLYIVFVCRKMGLHKDYVMPPISLKNIFIWADLIGAMAVYENGYADPKYNITLLQEVIRDLGL